MRASARALVVLGALCAVLPLAACSPRASAEMLGEWRTGLSYDGDEPYLLLEENGRWSASDGCNTVVDARWSLGADGALTVDDQPMTMIGCDGDAVPSAFSTARSVTVSDGTLVLHRDEGDVVLVRPGADAPGLTAQELAGRWADVDAPEVVLDLAAEGTLSGSDGCNRLMGSWELHDGRLQWQGGLATTRMHCPGVDTWLSGSAFAQPRGFGSWLRILDADGVELGHLQRSAPDAADPSATPDPGGS